MRVPAGTRTRYGKDTSNHLTESVTIATRLFKLKFGSTGISMSREKVKWLFNLLIDQIQDTLVRDGYYTIINFGTLEKYVQPARKGFNPKKNENCIIPAYCAVKFRSSPNFQKRLKHSFMKNPNPPSIPLSYDDDDREYAPELDLETETETKTETPS